MIKHAFASSPTLNKTIVTHHGALDYKELESFGFSPDNVLDFSSNINPFGPPPAVKEALANIDLSSYPDRDAIALRKVLSHQIGVDINQVVVGNGTAELIWLIAFAFVQPGDRSVVLAPTFGEYQRCVSYMGGQVSFVNTHPEEQFKFDHRRVEHALKRNQASLCFICNPNNPTGTVIPLEFIQNWAQMCPGTGFILDEAYLTFAPELQSAIDLSLPNLIILRSMTKDFSLAGLRLGYAAGPEEVITRIAQVRPAWNVNSLAQAAGMAALSQKDFVCESIQKIRIEKEKLIYALVGLGYSIPSSQTHFFIMDVGEAKSFRKRLLQDYLIQVRDCTSFGMPSYVRISTRQSEDNQRLISAIQDINK
ncbi:pyridoxal phosphate-dependent aminotransferase [Chloroflexota bacterium]